MNRLRRKALAELAAQIEELRDQLDSIMCEESEYRDNIPENLQGSERYESACEACDNMDCAITALEEALEYIESASE